MSPASAERPADSRVEIKITIQPLGQVSEEAIEAVKAGIESYFESRVDVQALRPFPRHAYYRPRNRYRADSLLNFLTALPMDADRMVGVTGSDISTTKGDYLDWGVVGLGQMGGRCCVVSTFRLGKNRDVRLMRIGRAARHELGHTFGLDHCPNPDCVLADARGKAKTLDQGNGGFCDSCAAWLKRKGIGLKEL